MTPRFCTLPSIVEEKDCNLSLTWAVMLSLSVLSCKKLFAV